MKVAVLKECRPWEKRVAATPDTVKKLIKLGLKVTVEKGAGLNADIPDQAFIDAGAVIEESLSRLLGDAGIVFKVQRPTNGQGDSRDELSTMKSGALLIALLAPYSFPQDIADYAKRGVTAFSLELLPRISRAQTMDALSSQSNLAGYRAVIDAAHEYNGAFPKMMTAAGTVRPAQVFVMGAGVAGLQAIATAKRLGAVVYAYDVRPAGREEAKSLGAKVIEVDPSANASAQTAGGYAKEMSQEYKDKENALIQETIKTQDIVICTALIPGKKAPLLVSDVMLKSMKPGSIVVDLAVGMGGNCAGSEEGKIVEKHGVKIIGHANFPSRLSASTSELYSRNLLNFVTLMIDPKTGQLNLNLEDEIIRETMLTQNGQIVHRLFTKKEASLVTG